MVSINKISNTENIYSNINNTSFKSKFVPNEPLRQAFGAAKYGYTYQSRTFARVIENLLNDGKDDLIQITKSKSGSSTVMLNGKRVYLCRGSVNDNLSQMNSIIDYFWLKNNKHQYLSELSNDEFNAIKPAINKLNADLNADDVTNNGKIVENITDNLQNIDITLSEYTRNKLDKLEKRIFNV